MHIRGQYWCHYAIIWRVISYENEGNSDHYFFFFKFYYFFNPMNALKKSILQEKKNL